MRVLVIAPQPFFSARGTPFSVYYRTRVTAELGLTIDLLTYGEGQDVTIPNTKIIRIPHIPLLGPVKTGPSLQKFFLDGFIILWTIALLVRNRYDIVHAHEESVFFCRFLKPLFRFKLIYDMHSSLPQQLTNFNFSRSRFLIGTFQYLENQALQSADAVITICPDLEDYALGVMKDTDKHFLIENSIFEPVQLASSPVQSADSSAADRLVNALPTDKRLIVYAGTLEHYQGIGLTLNAMKRVIEQCTDAFLLVVGGTPQQADKYRKDATMLGLADDCLFTGRLSQSAANALIDKATLLLSPRTEGTNTPLKIYQQLASRIPLVATDIYSHTQVLNDEVAFLAQPTPEAFGDAIVRALRNTAEAERKAVNAEHLYLEKYSRSKYEEKMRQLFAHLQS